MKSLKARQGTNVLSKVTRLFDSSLTTIFGELVQNARRAGATEIEVRVTEEGGDSRISFYDNGRGIADLSDMLVFTESGWESPTTEDEDPAGMGLFCLCNSPGTIVVESCGQRVEFEKDMFLGSTEAAVEPGDIILGTRISFLNSPKYSWEIMDAISQAVKYADIERVTFVNKERETALLPSGTLVSAENADLVDETLGVRIEAVEPSASWHPPSLKFNFHGIKVALEESQLPPPLCQLMKAAKSSANVEILHCRSLQMVLPARNAMMRNAALEQVFELCMRAIYLGIVRSGINRLPFHHVSLARSLGVTLPPLSLMFALKHLNQGQSGPNYRLTNGPRSALLPERAHDADLFDGLNVAFGNPVYAGYENYDAMPTVTLELAGYGETISPGREVELCDDLELTVVDADDNQLASKSVDHWLYRYAAGDDPDRVEFTLFVRNDSIDIGKLVSFITYNVFVQDPDSEDSQSRQEAYFEEEIETWLRRNLEGDASALQARLTDAIQDAVYNGNFVDSITKPLKLTIANKGDCVEVTYDN